MLKSVDKTSSKSASKQILEMLDMEINSLPSGSKIHTEFELCEILGISRMTVNKAVSRLVDAGKLYRIPSKGTFVADKKKSSDTVKILLPGPMNFKNNNYSSIFFQNIIHGMLRESRKLGMRMENVITTMDHNPANLDPGQFKNLGRNDNVLIAGQWFQPLFEAIHKTGCNVVYCSLQTEPDEFHKYFKDWFRLTVDVIGANEHAVRYLAGIGRKKILAFHSKADTAGKPSPQSQGYLAGLEHENIESNPGLLIDYDYVKLSADEHYRDNFVKKAIIEAYRKNPFDAVLIGGYLCVNGIMSALSELGLKIPEDVAIMSSFDCEKFLDYNPPISTYSYSPEFLGIEAARLFNRKSFQPGEKILSLSLIERESTKKGAGGREGLFLTRESKNMEFSVIF